MPVKSKTALTTDVSTDITTNGNNEITGAKLNTILDNIILSYEDFIGSYTTAQIAAIVSPTLRQIVFDTDLELYFYYNGSTWVLFGRNYKCYTGFITQGGTSAPTMVLAEPNTIGTIALEYVTDGQYRVASSGLFISNKTFFTLQVTTADFGGDGFSIIYVVYSSPSEIFIYSYRGILTNGATSMVAQNGLLNGSPFEIRVYY